MVAPEYRYPDNDATPAWARGKTAGDMLSLMEGLIQGAGRGASQPAPQQDFAPAADEDFVTQANLKAAQRDAMAQVSPWLATVADQQATMSYTMARQADQAIFHKYEPEILRVLQSVPRQNWTLDVIKRAVTMVKGEHVDELIADNTRQLEATMGSTMRSTGRAGLSSASPPTETVAASLAKVPAEWQAHAKAVGITEQQVHEFCWANETTPEEFFKQFGKGLVSDAIADVNFVRSSL